MSHTSSFVCDGQTLGKHVLVKYFAYRADGWKICKMLGFQLMVTKEKTEGQEMS